MKIFTKTNIAHKVLSIVLNFLLIFYSVAPGINASLVYAQEATSTATVEVTPSPSVEPTPLPTPSPSPSVLPEASPEITPSPSPSAEPSPTDQVENNSSPEPTVGQPNAPPAESPSPSLTPKPSPSAEVIQTAKGHLAATILENTNAQSLQLDLSTQGNVSSASLTTDKADYSPTDTAVITGSDFPKEAQLKLIITGDNYRFEDTVKTDVNGQFIYTYQLDGTFRSLYIVEAYDMSGTLLATVTFTDAPASGCTFDSAGANDVPGQKDLTKMCVNYSGVPTNINVSWNWDDVSWGGANTGDACSLFDTDGDGNANYVLCVGVNGNPAIKAYTKLYSCTDHDFNNCTSSTLISATPSSTCTTSLQNTDPFSAGSGFPVDTESNCNIVMSEVGGSSSTLIDVCSYPSGSPSSHASDCILFKANAGKLTVTKVLSPNTDPGLFNLQVDGTTQAANVGDGGTILTQEVSSTVTHTVGETEGTSTSLSNYTSSVVCKDGHGTGNTVSTSGTNPWTLSVADEQDILCTITNTRINNGSITIIKDAQPNDAQDFAFITTGSGLSSFSLDDDSDLTLSNTKVFSSLVAGTYSVSEGVVTDWTQTSASCTDGSPVSAISLQAGENVTCTFTNTRDTGTLRVIKGVVNDNGGNAVALDFTLHVKQGATDVTGSPAAGSATGTVYTLNTGSYIVSENTPPTGYIQTGFSGDCDSSGNVIVVAGTEKTCTITNDDVQPKLTVTKVVVNDNGGTKGVLDFPLFVDSSSVTSGVQNGFNAGTYTVSETNPGGYTGTITGDCASNGSITLSAGDVKSCTITNNDQSAHVIVIKNVTNNDNGTKTPSDFIMRINGTSVGVGVSFPGVSGLGTDTTVNAGNYTVSEDSVTGYSGSVFGDCSGSIANGETKTCTVTNDDQPAHVIVIKHVVNDNGGTTAASAFTMHINGTSVGIGVSFPGAESPGINTTVKAGSFAITEDSVTGYSPSTSGDCSGTVSNGETKTCTITNNDIAPTLKLVKLVTNDNGGTATASAWTLTAIGDSGFSDAGDSTTFHTVKAGVNYTLSESSVPGYTADDWSCNGGTQSTNHIQLAVGQTNVTCTITNNDQSGQIKIVKNTVGGNDTFGFTVNGPTSSTQSITTTNGTGDTGLIAVNAGSYNVSETTLPGGWDQTGASCDSGTPANFTVSNGGTVTCTFTNTKKGHLIVQKTTLPAGDLTSFTISASGSGTITNGGAGTVTDANDKDYEVTPGTYSVAETVPAGWDKTGDTCQSVVVAAGENKTCLLTNTKRGHVIITKDAIPNNAQDFTFHNNFGNSNPDTFLLDDDSNGTLPDTRNFEVIPGSYSVLEDAAAGWKQSSATCDDGSLVNNISVSAGETVTCIFTNKKLGSIVLNKNTIGGNGTFDFVMTGQSLPGSAQLITASGSATQTFTGIDPENTYTINETVPTGWDLTNTACVNENGVSKNNNNFTINNGGTVTCTFTNTKRGTIIVEKQTDPDQASGSFTFTGDASGTVSDGQQIVVNNLVPGTYASTEVVPAGWDLTNISCDDTNSTSNLNTQTATFNVSAGEVVKCTFTNTQKGHLTVQKVTIPGGEPDLFTIQATGSGTINSSTSPSISDGLDIVSIYTVTPGTYSVTETVPAGWDKTGDNCQGVVVGAGDNKTCTITNTKRGEIIIEKQIIPEGSQQSFEFSSSYSQNFFLAGGGTNNSGLLTPGTYSVSENTPEGWDLTNISCSDESNPQSISLSPGETVICTFTNTQRGTILGTKQEVNSDSSLVGVLSDWVIRLFSGESEVSQTTTDESGNFSFTNLVQGVYTLAEDLLSGWTPLFAPSEVTLNPGNSSIGNNFGNFQNGQITGMKFDDLNGNGQIDENESGLEDWTINLGGARTDSTATDGDGYYEFTDLGPGSYTVCEEEQVGWQRTKPAESNCETVNITQSNQTSTVDFGNQGRGSITVSKTTDPRGSEQTFGFNLAGAATGSATLADQGSQTFSDIPAGSYTLGEETVSNWTLTNIDCGEIGNRDGNLVGLTLNAGDSINCTFTNTRDTGKITILKNIDNNGDGDTTDEVDVRGVTDWTWDISEGEQNIFTGQTKTLPTETYTISEDQKAGYKLLGWSCSNEQTGTTNSIAIDVRNGSQTTCTFTNQLLPPVLTLTKANDKTGIDVSAGANVLYTLTVTLTGSSLANVSLIDLPPAGFKYRTGSWTASSNTNPGLVVSEPTYASPGAWNLGNMQTGETITLTYIADIDSSTDPGLYKDLAWSKGTSLISSAVLANESSGFFVGTEVNVVKDQGASTGVEVEKIEKREGEVLGVSTELPATGANAIWLILATFLLVGGAGLAWKGMTLRKKYE